MKIVIGIITHQRPEKVLRLLHLLSPQLGEEDVVWILENGSRTIDKNTAKSINSKISVSHLNTKSIPLARNILFLKSKKNYDFLVFLDDDVVIKAHWLEELKKQLQVAQRKQISVIQGNFHSFPKQNIYAQTTEILTQLWLSKNTQSNSYTRIIDTKHVAFNLKKLQNLKQLFDPHFAFASDIAAAARLSNHAGNKILFASNVSVFHQERTTWGAFVEHRFRLSKSYRNVAKKFPSFFASESTVHKFAMLWQNLVASPLQKIWILLNLFLIYIAVWVSNLITSLLRF